MHGPTCLDHVEPSRIRETAKVLGCAEHRRFPSRITKPTANTAVRGPQAPSSEFADDKPPSGLQNAGHFHNRSFGISNEAKRGHRKDKVKFCIFEWQSFRLSFDKMELSALDFGPLLRSGDHRRVCIEPRYDSTTPGKF